MHLDLSVLDLDLGSAGPDSSASGQAARAAWADP